VARVAFQNARRQPANFPGARKIPPRPAAIRNLPKTIAVAHVIQQWLG
jgi:hypothetical protein